MVGVLRLELHLLGISNLKQKRSVVQKALGRCRNRFPVSCAETGLQDLWQRSELGFAMVGNEPDRIQAVMHEVEEEILCCGPVEIIDRQLEMLGY